MRSDNRVQKFVMRYLSECLMWREHVFLVLVRVARWCRRMGLEVLIEWLDRIYKLEIGKRGFVSV